jgi:DNA-binding IclR family transcriptional regulator
MNIADSGVGVLDRSMAVLAAVEGGSRTLGEICRVTELPRPTAHRLAAALTAHGMLARDPAGGWRLGLRLLGLGTAAGRSLSIREAARPALEQLRDETGESTQLYVREGDSRVCIDVAESGRELRTIVPVGASLPLTAGSAGKVFLAFAQDAAPANLGALNEVVALGWAQSVGEREAGVASVSAPVLDRARRCIAAVSVSGPIERTGRDPGRRYAEKVTKAARRIEAALGALR